MDPSGLPLTETILAALASAGIAIDEEIGAGSTAVSYRGTLPTGEAVVVKVARGQRARHALGRDAAALVRVAAAAGESRVAVPVLFHAFSDRGDEIEPQHIDATTALAATVISPCAPRTLATWLEDRSPTGRFDPLRREVIRSIAATLGELHDLGVVHADLSLANIAMTSQGPMLIDFGAARLEHDSSDRACGTLPFVAPEVLRGEAPIPQSDLHALAHIAMAVITGDARRNTSVEQWPAALERHECDSAIRDVILASAAADPSRRPEHAAAWLDAIDGPQDRQVHVAPSVVAGDPDARERADEATIDFGPRLRRPAPPAPSTSRRVRLLTGVVATALLAILVGAAVVRSTATGSDADGASAPPATAEPANSIGSACAPIAKPRAALPPGSVQVGDLDGSGCMVAVTWDGDRAEAMVHRPDGTQRFRLGRPGDALLIGRWTCATTATPALYRSATGEVFVFDAWARPGEPAPNARLDQRARTAGQAGVLRDGACDRVTVT